MTTRSHSFVAKGKVVATFVMAMSIALTACGTNDAESRTKNAALDATSTSTAVAATAPSAPPQIFVKIDTIDTTPWCCQGTPRFVAKLRWSAPQNDGGSPIIGYDIQFKWNDVESSKRYMSRYKNWTSCADEDKLVANSFSACGTALTSTATSAQISSDYFQTTFGYGQVSAVKELSHIVQGLEYRVAAINAVGKSAYSPKTQLTCKYGGACEFGDLGPGGGVVYDVGTAASTSTGWSPVSASEVAGLDWEYSGPHSWAAQGFAAKTNCPGWSCYSPNPPQACAKSNTNPPKYASSADTCLTRDAWHLPFAMPLIDIAEWKGLCNKFDALAATWGRLHGNSGIFYWSASNVMIPAGISIDLTPLTITQLITNPGPGTFVEIAQETFDKWSNASLVRSQAIRYPCDSETKLINGNYDSNGRMFRNDGSVYHDNSVRTPVNSKVNFSRPIRTFTINKPGIAPQVAPVLSATSGDGGVILKWDAGVPDVALATKLKSAQILPLTDYAIEYKASSDANWTRLAPTASVTMSRILGNGVLSSGVKYDFRVAELNGLGVGPFSSPASAVPGRFTQRTLNVGTTMGVYPSVPLATSGGDGSGNVTYSVSNGTATGCSMSGTMLSVRTVGTCNVTATKAGDTKFLAQSSAVQSVIFTPAPQAALLISTTSGPFDEQLNLTADGGSGTGTITFAVDPSDTSWCSLTGNTLTYTPRVPGTGFCRVTATRAASTNFLEAKSQLTTINFTAGTQAAFTIDTPTPVAVPVQKVTVTAKGGSGLGEAKISVRNGTAQNCAVSSTNERGGVISADVSPNGFDMFPAVAGTCIVSVSRKADANFRAATSGETTVTFDKGEQARLSINGPTIGTRAGLDLSAGGGSGSGAVSFAIAPPGSSTLQGATNCRVNGTKLFADSVGSCWITATKTEDSAYLATTSPKVEFSMTRADQAAFSVTTDRSTTAVGTSSKLKLTTSGGSGTGSVYYAVRDATATGCSLTADNVISARSIGTCAIVATKGSDINFWEVNAETTFTFSKGTQAALVIPSSIRGQGLSLRSAVKLTTTGGSGIGTVTFTVTDAGSAGCTVAGDQLSAKALGVCTITATKAGDANYEPTTSTGVSVPFDVRLGDAGPSGGVIGYVAADVQSWGRYIEVAPDNWSGGTDPIVNWATALVKASAYRGGGRLDWRLPSGVESNLLSGKGYLYDPAFSYGYWSYDGLGNWNPDRKVRPIRTFG